MSAPRSAPQQGVPTLTEVVELGRHVVAPRLPVETAEAMLEERPRAEPAAGPSDDTALQSLMALEAQIVERVFADVQRQVDLMLEYRMREVLAPALTRVSDTLIGETRNELASTLREVVSRAVAQELSRHRGR